MTQQAPSFEDYLFRVPTSAMSPTDTDILFQQYKLYVEMMDKISERRHQANTFFLTVNTTLVTALAGFMSLNLNLTIQQSWIVVAAVAGITFCFAWRRLIQSYGQLNTGKFRIIHLLESRLPARLFDAEWEALNHGDGTLYTPFTETEKNVPLVFVGLYLLLSVSLIIQML